MGKKLSELEGSGSLQELRNFIIEKVKMNEMKEAILLLFKLSNQTPAAIHALPLYTNDHTQSIFDEVRATGNVTEANRFGKLCEDYGYISKFESNWSSEAN